MSIIFPLTQRQSGYILLIFAIVGLFFLGYIFIDYSGGNGSAIFMGVMLMIIGGILSVIVLDEANKQWDIIKWKS